jgi:uncharacterized protein (TIGR03066 family)
MRTERALLLAFTALLLPLALAGCGKSNSDRIVGTWEAAKGDMPPGSTWQFTTDGKIIMSMKVQGVERKGEGTYKIDGDKLTMTVKEGGDDHSMSTLIKTLNDTALVVEGTEGPTKGKTLEFKKK